MGERVIDLPHGRAAALVICGKARDGDDARMLLDCCGLFEPPELLGVALHRSCPGCGMRIRQAAVGAGIRELELCPGCSPARNKRRLDLT